MFMRMCVNWEASADVMRAFAQMFDSKVIVCMRARMCAIEISIIEGVHIIS
jgi:hypothetical protein